LTTYHQFYSTSSLFFNTTPPTPLSPLSLHDALPILSPPASGVTVRMYRQGLGDCFLLAFPTGQAGQAFYTLIDCGVIFGTQNPRSEEHTSELQSLRHLVCRLLLEKKKLVYGLVRERE